MYAKVRPRTLNPLRVGRLRNHKFEGLPPWCADPFSVFGNKSFSRRPAESSRGVGAIRCCLRCPVCSEEADDEESCMDLNGSCASPEGGICGRGDAAHGSFEAQKVAGSLHFHVEVNVECLHQHTPLWEVMAKVRRSGSGTSASGSEITGGSRRFVISLSNFSF